MALVRPIVAICVALALTAGCGPLPFGKNAGRMASLSTSRVDTPGPSLSELSELVGRVTLPSGIISNNGGSVISNNGGGIISDNGGGLIGNNGSSLAGPPAYRLTALQQQPVPQITVTLQDGAGRALQGADGRPLTAVTNAAGAFRFPAAPRGRNVVVMVQLAGAQRASAIAPRGRTSGQAVDVDLVSSLTTGFILNRYVESAADPQATLERLTPAVEAETRVSAGNALSTRPDGAPDALTEQRVVSAVAALGKSDRAFAAQLEVVRRLFVTAGVSDQGVGRHAKELNLDFVDMMALTPDGDLLLPSDLNNRIWRLKPDSTLETVVGRGTRDPGSIEGLPGPEAGLDELVFFIQDPQKRLVILEAERLSRLETDGTMHEIWRGFKEGKAVMLRPDGGAWLLLGGDTPTAWDIAPDGGHTLVHSFTGADAERVRQAWGTANGLAGRFHVTGFGDFDAEEAPWLAQLDSRSWTFTPVPVGGSEVRGFSLDAQGNLFTVEGDAPRRLFVRKTDGTRLELASDLEPDEGLNLNGAMLLPDGTAYVAFDGAVLFRIANHQRTWLGGLAESVAGDHETVAFSEAVGVAVSSDGDVYMADDSFSSLYRRKADETQVEIFLRGCFAPAPCGGDGPVTGASLGYFKSMVMDADDQLYVLDEDDRYKPAPPRLRVIDLTDEPATVTTRLTLPATWQAEALALEPDGTVLIAARAPGDGGAMARGLYALAPEADVVTKLLALPENQGKFSALATGPEGALWLTAKGKLSQWRRGGPLMEMIADERITGLALTVDPEGRPVLDFDEGLLRFDPVSKTLSVLAGRGGAILNGTTTDTSLSIPNGLAFDSEGNLHIADTGHNQFKVIPREKLR